MATRSGGFTTTGGSTAESRCFPERQVRSRNGLSIGTIRSIVKQARPKTAADERALELAEAKRARRRARNLAEGRA